LAEAFAAVFLPPVFPSAALSGPCWCGSLASQGVIYIDYLEKGKTVTGLYYAE